LIWHSTVTELGSVRQVTLWFRREKIALPAVPQGEASRRLGGKLPLYHTIWAILRILCTRGAYAFGKTEARTQIVEGRAHRTKRALQSHAPMDGVEFAIIIPVHFLGAIREESNDDCGQRRT